MPRGTDTGQLFDVLATQLPHPENRYPSRPAGAVAEVRGVIACTSQALNGARDAVNAQSRSSRPVGRGAFQLLGEARDSLLPTLTSEFQGLGSTY